MTSTRSRQALIFIFLLLPVLLLAVYSFYQTRRQLINQVYEERKNLAGVSAKMLHEKLDRLSETGKAFANWPTFRQSFDGPNNSHVTELMKTIPRDFPYISNVSITDTAGTVVAGIKANPGNLQKWHSGISKNWQPYLSEVYSNPGKPGQITSAMAIPINNMAGKLSGVLLLEVNINKLLEWSNGIDVGKNGFVYIVDQKGNIAINPNYKQSAAVINYSSVPAVQKALEGKKNVEVLYNPVTKEKSLCAYEQVPVYGWAVIVQEETGTALSVNHSIRTVLIFYIFFILLATWLIWIILRVLTRQRETAWELKKSDDKIHLLVDNVKDYAIFMLDQNGLVTNWNQGAEQMKGYTAKDILGQSQEKFYTPEDNRKGLPAQNLAIAAEQGNVECEGWRVKKDGSLFWANTVITALRDEDGELYGYSKITRDITDRRKAQEQLEMLSKQVNQSHEAIYTMDADLKIMSWNKGAETLYGYTKEEVYGKVANDILHTEISTEKINSLVQEIAAKEHITADLKRKNRNGEDVWVHVSSTTIRDEQNKVTGYISVNMDITERKKLMEQVTHLASMVEQSSEAIVSRGLDKSLISWNRGAELLLGYSKEEALGKTAVGLGFVKFEPDEWISVEKELAATGSWKSERLFYRKDGSSFFGLVTANSVKNEMDETTSVVFIIKDISLRKQLEEQLKTTNEELEQKVKERTEHLQRSEKQYRYLFDNNPQPMWVLDETSFQFLDVNEVALQHYGYSRDEFLSFTALDIRPAEDRKIFLEADRSAVTDINNKNRKVWNHCKKDGSIIQVEIIAHSISFQNKNARLILANDVTEKIASEEKLRSSEKRFRTLIENSNDIITLIDESFRLIYRSPAAAKITGWSNEDMINVDATRNIHPDDIEAARATVKEVMANPGKKVHTIFRNLHKDGHYIWMEGVLTNWLHDESIRAIVTNMYDVTERLEAAEKLAASELHYRSLIENSVEGISLMNEKGNVIYRSPSGEKLLGYGSKEGVIDFAHPDNLEMFKNKFAEALANPAQPVPYRVKYHHPDGHYFIADGTFTNLLHIKGVNAVVANYHDVTEKISAEEKMQASEKRFRALIEKNYDVIIVFDRFMKITYRSPSATIVTGRSDDETMGNVATSNIHPDDLPAIQEQLGLLLQQGNGSAAAIFRYQRKDGQYLWLEGTATNLLNDENVQGIIFNCRDVTKRKEAEEKLLASEEHFRTLIENSFDVINLVDDSLNVIYRSPSAQRITGLTDADNLHKSIQQSVHPDETEIVANLIKETLANPGKPISCKIRSRHKDGHYLWLEGTITNLLHNRYVNAVLLNFRDVTERVQAEERLASSENKFRALVEKNKDVIMLLDESFKVLYRSPSANEVNGWTDEDVKSMSALENIHPDDIGQVKDIIQQVLANPGKPHDARFRNRRKDGHFIWLEGVATNLLHDKNVQAIVFNFRDVTERIESAALLAASEERYRHTMDNMLEGIQIIGFDWRYIYVNDAMAKHGKYRKEELIGNTVMEIFPGIEQTGIYSIYLRCFEERVPVHLEYEFEYSDKSKAWFELSFQPLPEGIFILSVDITERKNSERKIEEQRAQLQTLGDNLTGVMIYQLIGDTDGSRKFTYVSNGVSRLTGKTPEQVMQDPAILYNMIIEEDQPAFLAAEKEASEALSVFNMEVRCRTSKNEIRWLKITSTPRSQLNGQVVWDGFHIDITEQREAAQKIADSEARFRALIENNTDAIVLNDADSNILYQSPSVTKILGYNLDERRNKKSLDYVHPESRDEFIRLFEKLKLTPGEPLPFQYRFLHKNGNYVWLEGVVTNLLNDPIVNAYVANYRDVTERKEAEENIKQLNEDLEIKIQQRTEQWKKTNDELEAFSYSISHDLRAPLRGIIGFTSILEEEYSSKLDDEAKRITGVIKSNTLKMGNLIDDLLSFSRTGRHEVEKTMLNSNTLVNEIIAGIEQKHSGDHIEWVVPPLQNAYADPTTIRQVWINLLSNAVKYSSGREKQRIEIGSYTLNNQAVFFVKDNGVGFDNKYADKLFRVFQRLHSSAEFEGTGVGLAIVEKIVSKHGGKVWANAVKGEGAAFYFSIPNENVYTI